MVKVRDDHLILSDGSVDLNGWVNRLKQHTEVREPALLLKAAQFAQFAEENANVAENLWVSSNSFLMGLEISYILAELQLDEMALIAGVLYRAVREKKATLDKVREQFGKEAADLIDGVLRMLSISEITSAKNEKVLGQAEGQLSNLRRMLVAMVDDVRVALIKLAERTVAIRAVMTASEEKQQKVAKEIFDIYAPLAHRLGIGHIKWELEDLSFRYLQPEEYKKIAKLLDEKRTERDQYIARVKTTLGDALSAVGIRSEVSGRAKHIYSIWRKMQRKNISFFQVYDIRAVRLLVPTLQDCYAVLGIVHGLWQHIPKEFDDYITTPKDNGYRSLHTAVLGPEGKVLEVQIRTADMHSEAELGVCAHWRYKEGAKAKGERAYEQKIAWLRQVLDWQEELGDAAMSSFVSQFRQDVLDDRVYVFTPEGHVVDLAMGATPIDFAYHIHTEVGHRCRGAKINGRIVPLSQPLRNGDQIIIITAKEGAPSRDWLAGGTHFVRTSRARAKIQHWFRQLENEPNIREGKVMLDKELSRLSLTHQEVDWQKVAAFFKLKTTDEFFADVGAGAIKVTQVLNALQALVLPEDADYAQIVTLKKAQVQVKKQDVLIEGVTNLLTTLAGCCKPVMGDPITGYVTQTRGITIHRNDCRALELLQSQDPDRILEAKWERDQDRLYTLDLFLQAHDRQGLLRDVATALAAQRVNLTQINTLSKPDDKAEMRMTVEVKSVSQLGGVLTRLSQIAGVIEVGRFKA